MAESSLAMIVEGDGEVDALPVLLRAWLPDLRLLRPLRVARDRFLRQAADQRRFSQLARRQGASALLVLLDAHEDCPVDMLDQVRPTLEAAFGGPVAVVVAVREFETWFLQCLPEFASDTDPELIRGAKERIAEVRGRYAPTADQAGLSARLALATMPRAPAVTLPRSLAKLQREVLALRGPG